ncbi:MAG: tetratricopeptide repeat protein [Candidatus Riflebacteria bacterium]|nr:tetratricopeptide repeat protein [Candidatus Riflebacteria bacterium]
MSNRRWLVLVVCCLLGGAGWAAGENPLDAGKQLEKAGQNEQALTVFLDGIRTAPSEELYREAGSLLGKMQKYDRAVPLLEEGIAKYPQSTPLMNLLGLVRFKTGDTAKAITLWEAVLDRNPNNSFAKDWLAKTKKEAAPVAEPPAAPTGSVAGRETAGATGLVGDPAGKLPLAEQEALAKQLYKDMAALDKYDLPNFDQMHRTVIRKCPDTDFAQQSCWRLSNLYLMAEDSPNHEGIIEVLEHLIKTYPDSLLVPEAKNRLLQSYRASGQDHKVVVFYEELFKLNPNPDERDFMSWSLEYAEALAKIDRKDQARELYEKVIQMDNNRDQLEARVARERLAGL